jgi:hypothetical protein
MARTGRLLFIVIGIVLAYGSSAQTRLIRGKIINEKTREPLPFVNIGIVGTNRGAASDVDGRFELTVTSESKEVVFSYLGFETFKLPLAAGATYLIIPLKEKVTELNSITIRPADNPALKIIQRTVKNKHINDPENLESFSYNCYNKLYSTLGESDGSKSHMKPRDSIALKTFADRSHLFLVESYTARKFVKPNFTKEVVLGNRMSGIKDPFFSFLATDFQPFSFYQDQVELFSKKYLNPLTIGSEDKYDFTLVDTVFHASDSVFVITFEPLPAKSFEGLKGQLYISSDGYALEHVMAEVADPQLLISPRIQQKYQKTDGHWFPVQLNTELRFKEFKIRSYPFMYVSRSYLSNVQIGEDINRKEFGLLNVTFDPNANRQNEAFWDEHRFDTLGRREKNTYTFYDSISGKLNALNNMMKIFEGALAGKFKAGKFYLPLEHFLKFNQYENVRLGVGLQTGEGLSKAVTLEGYAGYGVRDQAWKYGGGVQLNLDRDNEAYVRMSYRQDVSEPGRSGFMKSPGAFDAENGLRNWLATKMDSVEQFRFEVGFRPLRFSQLNFFVQQQRRNPTYAYIFASEGDITQAKSSFNINEFGVQGRFAFKETYMQIGQSKVVTNQAYPQINISASRSFSGWLDGDYEFSRVEVKLDEEMTFRSFGKTLFQISGGYSWGSIPYPYLFNGKGSLFDNSNSFSQSFLVVNYFQTMGLYEFTSDRYAYLFVNHNFGRLTGTKSKHFRPELSVVQNIGYGSMQNPDFHKNITFKTMDKGYFESGMLLSNLFRFKYVNMIYYGLGAGIFYRYGPYSLPTTSENLAYKVTVSMSF